MDLDPHHRANGPGRAARPLSREHRRRFAAANLQVVELTPRVAKETLRHAFRDAWRGHTWSQFLRTDSKAAEALQHCTWPQVRQRVHNMMMRWARGGEDRAACGPSPRATTSAVLDCFSHRVNRSLLALAVPSHRITHARVGLPRPRWHSHTSPLQPQDGCPGHFRMAAGRSQSF